MNLRQKESGIWVVDWVDDQGKRRRDSTKTRDKVQARINARRIVMGLSPTEGEEDASSAPTSASGRMPTKGGSSLTMDELFKKCELTVWSPREAKSQATIKSNLKVLRELVGSELVTDMTAGRLERLSQTLFERGYAAGTVKRKLDMVGKALTLATRWEDETTKRPYLTGKPAMPTISARNSRDRVLTEAEEAVVFETIAARLAKEPTRDWRRFGALVRFLLDTGARLGEALGVTLQDLELRLIEDPKTREHRDQWFVHFRRYRTKNDKPRQLPLAQGTVAELDYLRMAAAPDGRVFPLRSATVWYMWDNIREDMKEQGVDIHDVVLHTFRHTCLTRKVKAAVPIHLVSKWAGHSDIKVTWDHYAHLAPDDLLGAMG